MNDAIDRAIERMKAAAEEAVRAAAKCGDREDLAYAGGMREAIRILEEDRAHDCEQSTERQAKLKAKLDDIKSRAGDATTPLKIRFGGTVVELPAPEPDACDAKDAPQTTNSFHAHLDTCERCANRPWDLCPVGAKALVDIATGALR